MRLPLIAAALILSACGDDKTDDTDVVVEDTLTCAYLMGEDNCWASTVAESATCLPSEETGELAPDLSTCTFADGTWIDFDPALPLGEEASFDDYLWHLTVYRAAGTSEPCAELIESDLGLALTALGDTAEVRYSGFYAMDLTCPDGETYHASNAFDLMECESEGMFGNLPGTMYSYSGSSVSFSLLGNEGGEGLSFSCALPYEP
ncbi:MAG: hypothetical protein JXX28_02390 [Deltaproteobacteria bacterium]|nr:hypothetical protein [Deltaproteobacteria bacterium]